MTPITRFLAEVDVDLDKPNGDQILTNITDWLLTHPLFVAVIVLTALLYKAWKNRTVRTALIFIGGILLALTVIVPFGVID